jgi:hypothetical protein
MRSPRRRGRPGRASRYGRPGQPLASRLPWWLRPDKNPLRRPADRVERALCTGLIALFAAGTPVAAAVAGHTAMAATASAVRAEAAAVHEVRAHLLRAAPPAGPADPLSYLATEPAWWIAPDGSRHAGRLEVPAGQPAGATVPVWTTWSGRPRAAPPQHGQVIATGWLTAIGVIIGAASVLLGAAIVVRLILNARRIRGWARAWMVVGPRWTGAGDDPAA